MKTCLRERRRELKLSMSELALKAGVNYSSLCRWERGWQKPSLESAEKLAEVLESDIKDLFPDKHLKSREISL